MIKELKDFLFKGNVLDLAVAVVMGAAFNAIITSLVSDVITPLFLNPVLKAANVKNIAQLSWNGVAYGSFLSAVINFLIVGTTLSSLLKLQTKQYRLARNKRKKLQLKLTQLKSNYLLILRRFLKNKTNIACFNRLVEQKQTSY